MVSEDIIFMRDLAVVMIVAAVTTLLFHRIRLPAVLGYIIAGVIIGPYSPPFALVENEGTIEILGQLGIVFLLFGLGLEFNFRKLRLVGTTAFGAGTLQILLTLWLGYVVGRLFGLQTVDALFLGAIISMSSTVIIVKVVMDLGQQEERWAQIAFGILIVEDIVAVFLLTLIPSVAGQDGAALATMAESMLRLGLFVASALVLGILIVPRLVAYVAGLRVNDVLTVVILGLALGLALIGSYLGFSVALGAFMMGAIIAESTAAKTVEERVGPIRDMFTAIFFVTVGMLLDPGLLVEHWELVAVVTAAMFVGKISSVTFGVFLMGNPPSTALRAGFGLAQMGEFSFIIAALAMSLDLVEAPLFDVAVTVTAITAFTTPLLIRSGPGIVAFLSRYAPRPLVTYASLYDTWVRRIRSLRAASPTRTRAIRELAKAGAFTTIIVVILLLAGVALGVMSTALRGMVPLAESVSEGMVLTALGVLVLPFAYLYIGAVRRLGDILSSEAAPSGQGQTSHIQLVRGVLRSTFTLAGTVALGIIVLAITAPILPATPVLAVVLIGVVASGALLYRALARFQTRVDESLSDMLARPAAGDGGPSEEAVLSDLLVKYPWGMDVKALNIPIDSRSIGSTIGELHIRSEAGATVVGLRRGSLLTVNPPATTSLAPLDVLLLVGEPAHLTAAERLITKGPGEPTTKADILTIKEVPVEAGYYCVGMALGSMHLRERTGATVIGIKRGDELLKDPAPEMELKAGDVLLVLSTSTNLPKATELIRAECTMPAR